MEDEYRILGDVADALSQRRDVEVEEKKPIKVEEFKSILDEID